MKEKNKNISLLTLVALSISILMSFTTAQDKEKITLLKEQIQKTNELLKNSNKTKADILHQLKLLESQIGNRSELVQELQKKKIAAEKDLSELSKCSEGQIAEYQSIKSKYIQLLRLKWKEKHRSNALLQFLQFESFQEKIQKQIILSHVEKQRKKQLDNYHLLLNDYFQKQKLLHQTIARIKDLESSSSNESKEILIDIETKKKLIEASSVEIGKIKTDLSKLEQEKSKLEGIITKEIDKLPKSELSQSKTNHGNWAFPLRGGIVISKFGKNILSNQLVTKNNGIDIQSANAFVNATNAGEVIQIRQLPNQRFMVLIRHGDHYSVYSNMESILVRNGEQVEAGNNLGKCKQEDNGSYELHFEIWQNKTPLNPLDFIR